jgi:hypothetical protein
VRWTWRAACLFLVLCLVAVVYHTWQWGLAQQERGDLLAEQSRLNQEIGRQEARYSVLMSTVTRTCQDSLQTVAYRLGLTPSEDSFEVMQATVGAEVMGSGMGGGPPEKVKPVAKRKSSKRKLGERRGKR